MRPFILYTETVGLAGQLLYIIYAIEYCVRNKQQLYISCDYNMYGDLRNYFEFDKDVMFISGLPPGYCVDQTNCDTAHPDWTNVNAPHYKESIANFNKLYELDIPFERLREISATIKPLHNVYSINDTKYDAVLVRRGDKMSSGDNGFKYNHASDHLVHTQCEDVFVLSDDFNAIKECRESTKKNILSITPGYRKGFVAIPFYVTPGSDSPFIFKPLEHRISDTRIFVNEMYVAAQSERFIASFKTNVAMFIKLIHRNPENCVDIQA